MRLPGAKTGAGGVLGLGLRRQACPLRPCQLQFFPSNRFAGVFRVQKWLTTRTRYPDWLRILPRGLPSDILLERGCRPATGITTPGVDLTPKNRFTSCPLMATILREHKREWELNFSFQIISLML